MNDRPGCLSGIVKLLALNWIVDWLQDRFGFGRGGACGCVVGVILMLIFVAIACSIVTGTNWLEVGF